MPATATITTTRTTRKASPRKGLGLVMPKPKTVSSKKKTEDVSWGELQDITKKLIKEGKLKPFDKKYVYGNL
ncbi:hypothetical protein [Capnocytophaga sputigena]|jgi:hypothetical protein|uniref:hypothetical protein n=1 Tax=Capnocytophaga sputigena TaxID=1019 RepID=UPI0028891B1F|nr:hypothetical protein [Capnocytophaga sputigena]